MKKLIIIILALVVLLSTPYITTQEAKACALKPDYSCHRLFGGIGNYGGRDRKFYVFSSFPNYSNNLDLISAGVDRWQSPSTHFTPSSPVGISHTSSQYDSSFDVYYTSSSSSGVAGQTFYYRFWPEGDDWELDIADLPSNNWRWTEIALYPYWAGDTFDDSQRKAIVAHEFGHAFGIPHTELFSNFTGSIMHSGSTTPTEYPINCDINALQHLYPKSFTDIPESSYYFDAAGYCDQRDIMGGTGNNIF